MTDDRRIGFVAYESIGAVCINPAFSTLYQQILRYMTRFPRQRNSRLEKRILRCDDGAVREACLKLYLETFPEWKEGQTALFCDAL